MKLLTLLVVISSASSLADKKCTGIFFNDKYYETEIVKEGVNKIYKIALNTNDNTLYFIFEEIAKVPNRILGYVNLDNRTSGVIPALKNASAIAIDQADNKVYVGSSDGIFIINHNKEPQTIPVIYEIIESLFYKNYLIFTAEPKIVTRYSRTTGRSTAVRELEGVAVDDFILDDDDNIFFLQEKTRLFRIKLGTKAINSHESYAVNYLTTDINSRPYIITQNGVFIYNKYKFAFDKISNIGNLKAITFSKNNEPIYAVNDLIVRLKMSLPCYEY